MKKLLLLFVAMLSLSAFAQEKIDEGIITTKMTMSSENEQVNAQLSMVGDINLVTYFKGQKSRAEQSSPMTGNNIIIIDNDTKKMLVLMDVPMVGKKYMESEINDENTKADDTKVEETGDTKTIAGYVCKGYKVIGKSQGVDAKMLIYATDKIDAPNKETASLKGKIKGYPMYTKVEIEQMGMPMTITMEATSVKAEKVDDSKFAMTIPEGYTKMEKPKAPAMVD